ncbi:MAG: hypothetical protein ABI647_03645 [Gemmatimonadota bacterium]
MTSAAQATPASDYTELPHLLRHGALLGIIQAVLVALFSVVSRGLDGPLEIGLEAIILIGGIGAMITLPGLWTKARTIEGIAGAAAIGLFSTAIFMAFDVAIFQPIQLYTNRWLEIGGGSNWWYHPVWWMVGTYLTWMGAWILANQTAKNGQPSVPALVGGTVVVAAIIMAAAALLHFPGAAFGVGTFAVAVLPALALLVAVTGWGARTA